MSAQTEYGLRMGTGSAGGFVDASRHEVESRGNAADDGEMLFGLGAVTGDEPGKNVTLPDSDSAASDFEGVTVNSHRHEQDRDGKVTLRKGETVGVMRKGRIYARVTEDSDPAYGDAVYLVTDGDDAGKFTEDSSAGIAVSGVFLGGKLSHYDSNSGGYAYTAPVQIDADRFVPAESSETSESDEDEETAETEESSEDETEE